MKNKKAIDTLVVQDPIAVPWAVWSLWGGGCRQITFAGSDASMGEDYAGIERIRSALDWYVDQFGGKVKWEK